MIVRVEVTVSGDGLIIYNRSRTVLHQLSAFADSAVLRDSITNSG